MLSRALACLLAAAVAVALLLAGGQQAALAGGGPGTGTPYGGVTCGQSYAPQCDVTAGTGPSVGTPASPGTQAGSQPAAGGGAAGGCQGTENKTFGCVPAGCQVTVQTLACPIGAAAPAAPAPGGERDRDRHPGLGLPAPGRRLDGHLPGGGHPVHERGQPGGGLPGLRAHLHRLQRGAAGRRVPGDGHDHLGRHLAGSRRGGRGAGAAVHDRRGGVPGRGVPGAEHQRRDATARTASTLARNGELSSFGTLPDDLAPAWLRRAEAVAAYRHTLDADADLTHILESLLHIHHNRYRGIDRDGEGACRRLARQAALARRAARLPETA